MPSIRERKEAKLAEGGTRRKQRISQRSLPPVDTIRERSKGPQTPSRAVFLGNREGCAAPQDSCYTNCPLFL